MDKGKIKGLYHAQRDCIIDKLTVLWIKGLYYKGTVLWIKGLNHAQMGLYYG